MSGRQSPSTTMDAPGNTRHWWPWHLNLPHNSGAGTAYDPPEPGSCPDFESEDIVSFLLYLKELWEH